jgi:hypothetical protein
MKLGVSRLLGATVEAGAANLNFKVIETASEIESSNNTPRI